MARQHIVSQRKKNYFWDQTTSNNMPRDSTEFLKDFASPEWKNEHVPPSDPLAPTPSLWASKTIVVPARSIHIKRSLLVGQAGGRRGKMRCTGRKNKKALPWTAEDHERFVAGLEHFGLQGGLGRGGAELLSAYMGNRSELQVKSHMQKHLADLARGKPTCAHSHRGLRARLSLQSSA